MCFQQFLAQLFDKFLIWSYRFIKFSQFSIHIIQQKFIVTRWVHIIPQGTHHLSIGSSWRLRSITKVDADDTISYDNQFIIINSTPDEGTGSHICLQRVLAKYHQRCGYRMILHQMSIRKLMNLPSPPPSLFILKPNLPFPVNQNASQHIIYWLAAIPQNEIINARHD